MWLFTRYGFFSTACARQSNGALDPHTVMVRARRKAHLESLKDRFPAVAAAEIVALSDRDYRYRIIVSKATWLPVVTELAAEQEWSNFKSEVARFQGAAGSDYVHALHKVWDVMYRLQEAGDRGAAIKRSPDGAITNAAELTAHELAEQKVLCPACGRKIFVSWPEGWDGHAGHACTIPGDTPEERKANYKRQFYRLFR